MEHTLPDKPEIDALADALGIDPDAVVGKLVRLWVWADQHSLDGNALGVTEKGLDRRAGQTGLAAALRKVGWLEGRDGALTFPRFDRHNGQTAKSRAATNRRVAEHRQRGEHGNRDVTPPPLQKPLPEKRREEKREGAVAGESPPPESGAQTIPPEPESAEVVFSRFWALYPRKEGRQLALAAYQRNECLRVADAVMAGLKRSMASDQWSEPRYIPQAHRWLDEQRWEDDPPPRADSAGSGSHPDKAKPCGDPPLWREFIAEKCRGDYKPFYGSPPHRKTMFDDWRKERA